MNKNATTLTVAGLALVLSACGGGGGGSAPATVIAPASKVNQTLYTFDYDYSEDNATFDFSPTKIEIKDGIASESEEAIDSYALTENQLYSPTYLYKAQALVSNLNNWTFNELPNIYSDALFEEVSLNGTSIYETILPGFTTFLSGTPSNEIKSLHPKAIALKQNKLNQKFVSGATCLRITHIESRKNNFYFSFNTNISSALDISYDNQLVNLQNLKKLETVDNTVALNHGTWNGYRWLSAKVRYKEAPWLNIDMAFVEFNGKLYRAELENDFILDRAAQIAQLKLQIAAAETLAEVNALKPGLESLERSCYAYNDVAASTVINYINIRS